MSVVTNILLLTAAEETSALKLNQYLTDKYGWPNRLKQVDEYLNGGKAMESDVYGTAINYCNVADLLEHFYSLCWDNPESVQLLLREEEDDCFNIYMYQKYAKLCTRLRIVKQKGLKLRYEMSIDEPDRIDEDRYTSRYIDITTSSDTSPKYFDQYTGKIVGYSTISSEHRCQERLSYRGVRIIS